MKARLLIILGIALLVALMLRPAVIEKRTDRQVAQLLLTVQHAVQNYHIEHEAYPQDASLTGAQLIQRLLEGAHLEALPHNPWTGTLYQPNQETEASDRLRYRSDALGETFTLEALHRSDESVHRVIDSTEHPSLEAPRNEEPAPVGDEEPDSTQ